MRCNLQFKKTINVLVRILLHNHAKKGLEGEHQTNSVGREVCMGVLVLCLWGEVN